MTTPERRHPLLTNFQEAEGAFAAEVRTVVAREPFEAPAQSEIEDVLVAAVAAERGEPPRRLGAPYWTDAALVAAAGIPTVLFGPTGGGIHQPTEWLDVESAHIFQRALQRAISAFAS